ncbi:RidA family protein [Sabulicella glaciei]|uniref:RidA family protein n=1 Tax=Sabulicella glaciei TaxID=2984948 RepID=A0ABT3NYB1_9PROT|nr:RidA family protein [Roseococcus sp. MDT2-1-1]MCW8087157.1 RidA family protein [Roseococcus sp. MDT2-1-1]
MGAEARLTELGLSLPEPAAPVANYIPFTRTGNIVFISGQVPRVDGKLWPIGQLGNGVSLEDGKKAAEICMLAILAHAKVAAGGDLDRVRILKLVGFVNSAPSFGDQPAVVNGASDCAVAVLGEKGRHARSAVGVAALPGNVAVEVEAMLELG